jgi:hypothetical protein
MRRMICEQSNHQWLGRFAIRLMQLDDDVTLPQAVRRAVAAHAHAGDMLPEEAAGIELSIAGGRRQQPPVDHNALARLTSAR